MQSARPNLADCVNVGRDTLKTVDSARGGRRPKDLAPRTKSAQVAPAVSEGCVNARRVSMKIWVGAILKKWLMTGLYVSFLRHYHWY